MLRVIDLGDGPLATCCRRAGAGGHSLTPFPFRSRHATVNCDDRPPLDHALTDGEDFELCTVAGRWRSCFAINPCESRSTGSARLSPTGTGWTEPKRERLNCGDMNMSCDPRKEAEGGRILLILRSYILSLTSLYSLLTTAIDPFR